MSEPAKDELLKRLGAALAEQESVTMALIWTELGELYTNLGATEDQAAAALRDACKALEEPEADLARRDREIADAEGRCVQWSEQLSDKDPDTRANARNHYQEWSAEVDARRAKRDEAERGYRELFEAREEQRTRLRIVQAAKRRVMVAQLNPFGDPMAQATEAYTSFRMPYLNFVLLRNDRESPEWDRAIEELRELCLRSAYRTDDLPSEAEQMARAMTSMMPSAAEAMADPVPNAADVMAQTAAEMANKNLAPDYVEDRRFAQPVRFPVQQRSYMQYQSMRDLGIR